MSDIDREKVDAYFDVINERILKPIQETGIQDYCTATLLILFAAIDGLGKLLILKKNANSDDRISAFLIYMGSYYEGRKNELVTLRNSLVHNGLNVDAFFSHVDEDGDRHLKEYGTAGLIYVNTANMCNDFAKAFERFCEEIRCDPVKMKRAADRLEMVEVDHTKYLMPDEVSPSLPAPVRFVKFEV